jgi:hypothetical protein
MCKMLESAAHRLNQLNARLVDRRTRFARVAEAPFGYPAWLAAQPARREHVLLKRINASYDGSVEIRTGIDVNAVAIHKLIHAFLMPERDGVVEIDLGLSCPDLIVARVTKQRDLECQGIFPFKLRTVALGLDRRGKQITSCVVERAELPPPPLSDVEAEALQVLNSMLFEGDGARVSVGACLAGASRPGRRIPAQRGPETGVRSVRVTRLLFPLPLNPL